MRKTSGFLIILFSILISTGAFGQFSRFGVKAGLNMSNMTVEGNNDQNLKFGLHAGVFNKIMILDKFAVQPELLYSSKGFKNNFDESLIADGEAKFNLSYIDLPVKLVYYLAEDFSFQFGPYVGYMLNANVDTDAEVLNYFNIDSQDEIDRDRFNAIDFGLTGGLSFELAPLVVGFNYNIGLTQVAKDNEPTEEMLGDAKNTVIQIYAGILF
mgnify:CR=1 FL=1